MARSRLARQSACQQAKANQNRRAAAPPLWRERGKQRGGDAGGKAGQLPLLAAMARGILAAWFSLIHSQCPPGDCRGDKQDEQHQAVLRSHAGDRN